MKIIVDFLFVACFAFWLLLAILELIMPGFAIYYIDLSLFLIVIFILFLVSRLLKD